MTGRCAACPVAGDQPCLATTHPETFAFFCEWAEGEDHQRRHIVIRSAMPYESPTPIEPAPPAPNPHADRDRLIRSCDRRIDAVGLERGDGCGCTPATRCLLRRGKWPDDPFAVDYSDCLACVSSRA